jgi:hypothetical protein
VPFLHGTLGTLAGIGWFLSDLRDAGFGADARRLFAAAREPETMVAAADVDHLAAL